MTTVTEAPGGTFMLPRELGEGVIWLGDCFPLAFHGAVLHSYDSAYLIRGTEASLLVEAGLPVDSAVVDAQLAGALLEGPPLRYVWVTHQETPHAGGIARILRHYPDAVMRGNTQDYHLLFPELADRFVPTEVGESIDLGGTSLAIVDAVIKDLPTSQWAVDTRSGFLFPGDGFAYSHYHEAAHCAHTADEVKQLGFAEEVARFSEQSLYWARFAEIEPYIERLRALIAENNVRHVGPTHGLPIMDLPRLMPEVERGLRMANSEDRPDIYRS
jgi:flavorubredoxin